MNANGISSSAKFSAVCAAIVLVIIAHSFVSCATGKSSAAAANGGKYYAVTAEKAAFFKYGPQQGNGSDMQLPKDTLVSLIHSSFGYCKVKLLSGEQGYIASDDIRVAPANLIAAANAPPTAASSEVHGERFNFNSNDPRLVPPPEPLPDASPVMAVEPDPLQQ